MGNTMYLECYSGISGDMAVAALLDLGADEDVLRGVLKTIPAKGFETQISRVKKAGIDCCDFNVKLDEEHENHACAQPNGTRIIPRNSSPCRGYLHCDGGEP